LTRRRRSFACLRHSRRIAPEARSFYGRKWWRRFAQFCLNMPCPSKRFCWDGAATAQVQERPGAGGIPFEDAQGRRVDLHSLRVTLGTNLISSGAPLVVVKELMRHSDIKTTLRHYADFSQLPLAEAVANLPALTVPDAKNHAKQAKTA